MDAQTWLEVQEGLLYAFGPVLFWWLVLIVAAVVLSIVGVLILEAAAAISR